MEEVKTEGEKFYAVLKDWGDHKANEVVGSSVFDASVTPEVLAGLLADGTLAEAGDPIVIDENNPMVDHVVTEEDIKANPDAGLVLGDTIQIPKMPDEEIETKDVPPPAPPEDNAHVAEGAEQFPEKITADAPDVPEAPVSRETPKKRYWDHKEIISETEREVGGKTYKHVTLSDRSEQDLTEEQYELITSE